MRKTSEEPTAAVIEAVVVKEVAIFEIILNRQPWSSSLIGRT
jgi:hypothetical protein